MIEDPLLGVLQRECIQERSVVRNILGGNSATGSASAGRRVRAWQVRAVGERNVDIVLVGHDEILRWVDVPVAFVPSGQKDSLRRHHPALAVLRGQHTLDVVRHEKMSWLAVPVESLNAILCECSLRSS